MPGEVDSLCARGLQVPGGFRAQFSLEPCLRKAAVGFMGETSAGSGYQRRVGRELWGERSRGACAAGGTGRSFVGPGASCARRSVRWG